MTRWLITMLFVLAASLPAQAAGLDEAQALLDQGQDAEAVDMLTGLAEQSPSDYRIWFLLGVAEAHRRNFQPAIRHFRHVLKLRPTLAEPHNNLAVIYNELGDLRAAVRELEASLELNPDYATAHQNIGDMYVKLALESYQKAMIDSDDPRLKRRYERLLHLDDDAPQARPESSGGRTVQVESSGESDDKAGDSPRPEVRPLLSDADRAEVLAAIEAWRSAWSARNIEGYFSAYASDFTPPARFSSRAAWERYKRRVIGNKSFIDVKLDTIRLSALAQGKVRADFRQDFRSPGYRSRDHKELVLEKTSHGWKIVRESVL